MADQILVALCSSAAIKYMVLYFGQRSRPSKAKLVGKVTSIVFYPVKSLKGIPLQEATFTPEGLRPTQSDILDRHFMVCNPNNGSFLTQRQEPKMVLVSTEIDEATKALICRAPGIEDLKVPLEGHERSPVLECRVWGDHLQGVHCGEQAEKWFTKYLGRPACLVYSAPWVKKRNLKEINTSMWHAMTEPHDKVAYPDFAPYLLTTEASLADLNSRLTNQVPMENFRPNIVVDASNAYAEDGWDELYVGDMRFRNLKLCGRCVMTTVDQKKGIKDPTREPLKTLTKYRQLPSMPEEIIFGINLFADFDGKVSVGQSVYATLK